MLAAVLAETTSWSKLTAQVRLDRIAAAANVSVKQTGRSLAELASGMLHGVASMLGVGMQDYETLSLPHHPLGTLVSAADVAGAIVWLASDAAARITGAILPVDAGFTAR